MATYRFTGPVRWAKVHTPDKKYEHYGLEIKIDASAYENTGLSGGPSKDGEGYYSFRRKPDSLVWKNKQQVPAGKPLVLDASGAPTDQLIGNGSVCTIEITVFDYDNKFGKGKGHRLEAVRIDELVEYVPPVQDDSLGANF
jgi:hypothetical protein